ncbi:MAG TPA: hypothetical protein VIU64_11835 [Polyangia bacterium]
MAQITIPDWLGSLLFGIRTIFFNGTELDDSTQINVKSPLTARNNSVTKQIDLSIDDAQLDTLGTAGAGLVTDWYIATNGNDSNDGRTSGTPLASLDGLAKNLGLQAIPDNVAVTVHIGPGAYTGTTSTFGAYFDFQSTRPLGGAITWQGTRTYVGGARSATPSGATATVTAVTQWDGTARTEGLVTATGVNFSTYNSDTGYFVEVVGGARDGLTCPISWLTNSAQISGNTGKFKTTGSSAGLPQVGDVLRVYSCSSFPAICFLGNGTYNDLDLGPNDPTDHFVVHSLLVSPATSTLFQNCLLRGLDCGGFGESPVSNANDSVIYRSHFGGSFDATRCTMRGGVEVRYEGTLTLDGQCHVLASGFVVGVDSSGACIIKGLVSFELPPTGTTLLNRSIMRASAQTWWRDAGGLSQAVILSSGSLFTYSAGAPAFVGTTASANLNVGGAPGVSAPFFNPVSGAGVLSESGQGAPVTVTGQTATPAALRSLLTGLSTLGLINDSSSNADPLIFALDVTLVSGTKTQASGKNLSAASVVAVLLKTPSGATGQCTATISGNNVAVTSFKADATANTTDTSTYTVMLIGAV